MKRDVKNSSNNLYAFSGIDGSGKSTLLTGVNHTLQSAGHAVHISKSYTDAYKQAFGPFIETADDTEIMFMFQAFNRRQYRDTMAQLAMGKVVLADRWSETYEEYHSQHGRLSQNEDLRHSIDNLAYEGLQPRVTFYVNTPPEIAAQRTSSRGQDFFDAKNYEYHANQAAYYGEIAATNDKWVTLDGTRKPGELIRLATRMILRHLEIENLTTK